MTKKLLWGAGILLALILVFVLGLSLFIKNSLKSEKLKAIIIPRAEEFTGRKVDIDQIHISLFRGIIVRGIHLRERDGEKDFLAAKEFILDYNLIPLLRKEIVIKKIEILSPSISLRREGDGKYNFSDLAGKERGQKERREPPGEKGFPFTVVTDKIYIRDATVAFADEQKELPDVTATADIEMTVFAEKLKEVKASGVLHLRELKTTVNGVPTSSSGTITIDREAVKLSIETAIGGERIGLTGTIRDYLGSPDITLDLAAGELDLGKLIAVGGKKSGTEGEQKKAPHGRPEKVEATQQKNIRATGEVKVGTATYKAYRIKDLALKYQFVHHGMVIEPLRITFSGGEKVRAEGVLNGSLRFSYIPGGEETAALIKRSIAGKGSLVLSRCEVMESKITDAMALFTGLEELKRPRFESGRFDATVKDQKISLEGGLSSGTVRLNTSGTIGFDERLDISTDLKLSPVLAAKLPTAKITGYLKDGQGWSIVPLKITGTVDRPSVKPNPAALRKQVEQGIREEVGKGLFKGILGK